MLRTFRCYTVNATNWLFSTRCPFPQWLPLYFELGNFHARIDKLITIVTNSNIYNSMVSFTFLPRVFSIVLVSLLITDVECVFPDTWFGVWCCDRRQETGSELHKTELFLFSCLVDELKPAKVESDAATNRMKHILQDIRFFFTFYINTYTHIHIYIHSYLQLH